MQIGPIDLNQTVMIVAEIGNNHEGNFEVAQSLVYKAAECGVHAVKFQTFQTQYFVRPSNEQRYKQLSGYELSYIQFEALQQLAKSLGLLFISTPLDLESAVFLASLVDCYKIASGDNNLYPLLERVAVTGKPVIVSSGLSDMVQMQRSVKFIRDLWQQHGIKQELAVLQCTTNYPAPPEQINLAAMRMMSHELGCTVGYSDHTLGIQACLFAVAAGARIIEKHFTLGKNFSSFRDHQLSADPDDMVELVEGVQQVQTMLGKPEKAVQPCEEAGLPLIRRSIVAARTLPAGHSITLADLIWMRPADGLHPGEETQLLGHKLKHEVSAGERIMPADVE